MTDKLYVGKIRAAELGLNIYACQINIQAYGDTCQSTIDVYNATDIHRLLGDGARLLSNEHLAGWFPDETDFAMNKQALIIGIRPIAPETREQKLEAILQEFVKRIDPEYQGAVQSIEYILARAKELLDSSHMDNK